jgi:hypothetical protein
MLSFLLPLFRWLHHHNDNTLVADVVDGLTQHGHHNQITNAGDSLFIYFSYLLLSQLINISMQSFKFMIILDQCLLYLINFNDNVHLQLGDRREETDEIIWDLCKLS